MKDIIIQKKFSKEEIKFIKENYTGEKDNVINIAKRLNRSIYSVRNFAARNFLTQKIKREPELYLNCAMTPREHEIYNFIIKGFSVKDIAKKLNISPDTVRTHKNAILAKNNVNSVLELLAKKITELNNADIQP